MRRCAASIGANIAEGCGKRGNGEFQRFLTIAAGSASELEYHFLLARDFGIAWTRRLREPQFRGSGSEAYAGIIDRQGRDRTLGELNVIALGT